MTTKLSVTLPAPRCSVSPLPGAVQPRPVYAATYSTSHVSKWKVLP